MNTQKLVGCVTVSVAAALAGQALFRPMALAQQPAHGPTLLPRPTATAVPFLPGAPKPPIPVVPAPTAGQVEPSAGHPFGGPQAGPPGPTPNAPATAPTAKPGHQFGGPQAGPPGAKPTPKKVAAPKKPAKAPAPYVQAMNGWHKLEPTETPDVDERGVTRLVLHAINTRERVSLTPTTREGGFCAVELERAAHLLRDPRDGGEHPVEPRLLDFAYKIQRHFDSPVVRVISGYRTPHGGHSNHGRGRAIDLVVPGVKDDDVASFARQEGFAGIGVYPVSGFVHVDVREHSYFWLDASGPGRKNREHGILSDVATKSDVEALARGLSPMPRYGCGVDVTAALGASVRLAAGEGHEVGVDEEDAREETP